MDDKEKRVERRHKESNKYAKLSIIVMIIIAIITIATMILIDMGFFQKNDDIEPPTTEPPQRIATVRYDPGDAFFPLPFSVVTFPIDNDGYIEFAHSWWEPQDKGLQFVGWVRENNPNYGVYPAGHSLRFNVGTQAQNPVITFFADMELMDIAFIDSLGRVTVYYDSNGGFDSPSPRGEIKNSVGAVQLRHPTEVPTRAGYRFAGWQVHGDVFLENGVIGAGQYIAVPMGNPTEDDVLIFRPQWERVN